MTRRTASTINGATRLVAALGLLALTSCEAGSEIDRSGPGPGSAIWSESSAAIDFALLGPFRDLRCTFSATRAELTSAQLEGLSSLRLVVGPGGAGCDVPTYTIDVQA